MESPYEAPPEGASVFAAVSDTDGNRRQDRLESGGPRRHFAATGEDFAGGGRGPPEIWEGGESAAHVMKQAVWSGDDEVDVDGSSSSSSTQDITAGDMLPSSSAHFEGHAEAVKQRPPLFRQRAENGGTRRDFDDEQGDDGLDNGHVDYTRAEKGSGGAAAVESVRAAGGAVGRVAAARLSNVSSGALAFLRGAVQTIQKELLEEPNEHDEDYEGDEDVYEEDIGRNTLNAEGRRSQHRRSPPTRDTNAGSEGSRGRNERPISSANRQRVLVGSDTEEGEIYRAAASRNDRQRSERRPYEEPRRGKSGRSTDRRKLPSSSGGGTRNQSSASLSNEEGSENDWRNMEWEAEDARRGERGGTGSGEDGVLESFGQEFGRRQVTAASTEEKKLDGSRILVNSKREMGLVVDDPDSVIFGDDESPLPTARAAAVVVAEEVVVSEEGHPVESGFASQNVLSRKQQHGGSEDEDVGDCEQIGERRDAQGEQNAVLDDDALDNTAGDHTDAEQHLFEATSSSSALDPVHPARSSIEEKNDGRAPDITQADTISEWLDGEVENHDEQPENGEATAGVDPQEGPPSGSSQFRGISGVTGGAAAGLATSEAEERLAEYGEDGISATEMSAQITSRDPQMPSCPVANGYSSNDGDGVWRFVGDGNLEDLGLEESTLRDPLSGGDAERGIGRQDVHSSSTREHAPSQRVAVTTQADPDRTNNDTVRASYSSAVEAANSSSSNADAIQLAERVAQLESRIDQYEREVTALQNDAMEKSRKLLDLDRQLEVGKGELEDSREAEANERTRAERLTLKVRDLEEAKQEAERVVERLKQDSARNEEKLQREIKAKANQSMDKYRSQLESELQSLLKGKDSQLTQMRREMQSLKEANKEAEANVAAVAEERESLKSLLNDLQSKVNFAEEKHQEQMNRVQQEHAAQLAEFRKWTSDTEYARRDFLTMEERLRKEISQLETDKLELESRFREQELDLSRFQQMYADLGSELATLQQKHDALQSSRSEATSVGAELRDAQSKLQSAEQEVTTLRSRLEESKELRKVIDTDRQMAERELQMLKEENVHQQTRLKNLQAELAAASSNVAALGAANATTVALQSTRHRQSLELVGQDNFRREQSDGGGLTREVEHLRRRLDDSEARIQALVCEKNILSFELQSLGGTPPTGGVARARGSALIATSSKDEDPGAAKGRTDAGRIFRLAKIVLMSAIARFVEAAAASFGTSSHGGGSGTRASVIGGLPITERHGTSLTGGAPAGGLSRVDKPIRSFCRVLYVSHPARSLFAFYLLVLHLWVILVLHLSNKQTQPQR